MVITSHENYIEIDGINAYPKDMYVVKKKADSVNLVSKYNSSYIKIPVKGTTIDGTDAGSVDSLYSFFKAQGFKDGGGTGEGVQGITGDLVDNTDPQNPVINNPTWGQVSDKPAEFPPEAHTHPFAQVTGIGDGNLIFGTTTDNEARKIQPDDLSETEWYGTYEQYTQLPGYPNFTDGIKYNIESA